MKSVPRRGPAHQHGQSIVEFALVVPLFLLILFALIDFARMEFSYLSLADATREMARSAAIPATCLDTVTHLPKTPCNATTTPSSADLTTSVAAVNQSFKNFEGMIISPAVSGDSVTITVSDRKCVALLAAGNGPCSGLDAQLIKQCFLPLDLTVGDPTYCAVPDRFGKEGGSVDVAASFTFTFNPLFQNRLTGIVDASFIQQFANLSTTARAYIE